MDEITERVGEEPFEIRFRPCPLLAAINELLPVVSDSEASEWASSSYTSDEYQHRKTLVCMLPSGPYMRSMYTMSSSSSGGCTIAASQSRKCAFIFTSRAAS